MVAKLKAIVIEPCGEDWGMVNMTDLMTDGTWVLGLNLITTIEDVVERAHKEDVPILHRKTLETLKEDSAK